MPFLTDTERPAAYNEHMLEQGSILEPPRPPTPLQKIGQALWKGGETIVGGAIGGAVGSTLAYKVTMLLDQIPALHEALSLNRDTVLFSTTGAGLLVGSAIGAAEIDTCRKKIARCAVWVLKKSHIRELPSDMNRPMPLVLEKSPRMSTTPSRIQQMACTVLKNIGHGIEMTVGGAIGGIAGAALIGNGVRAAFFAAGIHDIKEHFGYIILPGMAGLFLGTVTGAALVHAKQDAIHACISKLLSRAHLN